MKNSALLKSTSGSGTDQLFTALDACLASLAACNQAPGESARAIALRQRRQEVARAVTGLSKKQADAAGLQSVLGLQRMLVAAGAYDGQVSDEELALANELKAQGPGGLLAMMLLVPAWQFPAAPDLADVPAWLWGDYATWLFFSPGVEPVETAKFSAHWLKRLKALAHWVQRNAGSAAVQAALDAYLRAPLSSDLFTVPGDIRRQAELRGQILSRTQIKDRISYDPLLSPRDGRRLRVGFVARNFAPGVDLFTSLPCFENLDTKNYEVFLLALEESDAPEAKYAARRTKLCQALPTEWAARIELIRSGKLDVLVFVGDFGGGTNDITRLALHRLAALQVVIQRDGATTGLPEIDLYVSGAQPATTEAGERFTERIGLLRGPSHSFNFVRAEASATPALSKEQLGIEEGVTALATVVTSAGVSGATLKAWAEILQRCPEARLFIAFVQDEKTNCVENICMQIDATLERAKVDTGRVTIFPSWGGAAQDVRSLLAWADLYLDTTDARSPVWLAEALVAGLPAIGLRCPGNPDLNAAADMLVGANTAELIATDLENYVRLAVELTTDTERRGDCRSRVKTAVAAEPAFLDSLAASDAFGALIGTAYDELSSLGREQFRQQREPLQCFGVEVAEESVETGLAALARGDLDSAAFDSSLALRTDPTNHRVRTLHGRVLHAQGEHSRAVDYLVAAVQDSRADADVWLELAKALRDNRQIPQAIEALETCMHLAPKQVEPLLMMLDLAEAVGSTEIAREVLQVLQQVAPDDSRVLAMS